MSEQSPCSSISLYKLLFWITVIGWALLNFYVCLLISNFTYSILYGNAKFYFSPYVVFALIAVFDIIWIIYTIQLRKKYRGFSEMFPPCICDNKSIIFPEFSILRPGKSEAFMSKLSACTVKTANDLLWRNPPPKTPIASYLFSGYMEKNNFNIVICEHNAARGIQAILFGSVEPQENNYMIKIQAVPPIGTFIVLIFCMCFVGIITAFMNSAFQNDLFHIDDILIVLFGVLALSIVCGVSVIVYRSDLKNIFKRLITV